MFFIKLFTLGPVNIKLGDSEMKRKFFFFRQCVRSGTPIIPDDESGLLNAESVAAWVRCSAADLYFRKDPKVCS